MLRDLGLTPALLGLFVAAGGVGELGGAVIAERVANRIGAGRAISLGALIAGCTVFLTPLAGGSVWLAVASMLFAQLAGDAAMAIHQIGEVSLRQTVVPDRLLGRASATIRFVVEGVGPVGALLGGALAEVLGVRVTLFVAAAGIFVASLVVWLSPIRRYGRPPAD